MRITLCVDALQSQLSGIGRYTWELAQGLARQPEICRAEFYSGHTLVADPAELRGGGAMAAKPGGRLRRMLRKRRVEKALTDNLVHGPNYFLPSRARRGVVTVHDLSVFRYPEMHPPERVQAFERLFASSLERAVHLITDTEAIRQEVMAEFSIQANAITAIPLGVDRRFRPLRATEANAILVGWNLSAGGYGLSVAAFEPRKKLAELIGAWSRLPGELRSRYPLVLAGGAGWENQTLHQQILAAEREGWVINLGFVDDHLLPALYAGARLFVYPSIYEGFGLPPVEAMSSGTPVIVSNRSCLPEVCGDAARYVDPDNPDEFTAAIEESLGDEPWRQEAIVRGLERSRLYNWESCIADTVGIYRKVWAAFD